MWILVLVLVVGFIALVWSADIFVEAAAAFARNLSVSELVIGLTVVSIGTSAPEILVSVMDSFTESPEIAIGNAIGSNIANMGLVLGVTALFVPLPFGKRIQKSEFPLLLGATVLAAICLVNLFLDFYDGLLFLALFAFILYRVVISSSKSKQFSEEIEYQLQGIPDMSMMSSIVRSVVSLIILLAAARSIVWAAESIAIQLNVNEMIIGLTIVACGTSLPELAVTLRAALKDGHAIAIGNIIGSNLLNLLVVLSVPALLHPTAITTVEYFRDFGTMFGLTVLLGMFIYIANKKETFSRVHGGILLLIYITYIALLTTQSA